MSSTTEYQQDDELTEFVNDLIQRQDYAEFSNLRKNDVQIIACYVIKTDKDGIEMEVSGSPVKLKKVPDMFRMCMKGHPHFVLVVCRHTWSELNDETRKTAMVHEVLWQVDVAKNDDGTLKFKNRKPDVVTNSVTLMRFGAWNQALQQMKESFAANRHKFIPKTAEEFEARNERRSSHDDENEAPAPVRAKVTATKVAKVKRPDPVEDAEDETPIPRRTAKAPVRQEVEDDDDVMPEPEPELAESAE